MCKIVILGLGLASLLVAAPAFAAKPDTHKLPVKEHILPNGLKVLLLERHAAPVISFQVWYRVGSRNEQVGQSGLSHLLEHLMFQGSKKFPTGAYDLLVERNGGSNNAFTTEDYTAYYINFPSDKLDLAAQLEADRMAGLLIPPKKFLSELNVVKEERRWRTDNDPFGMMWEMLGATAYAQHSYRWPVVGWMSDLDRLQREDAQAYFKTHYMPNNATVVVVGDFQSAKALEAVSKYFGPIPKGKLPAEDIPAETPQRGERRTEVVKDVETPSVMIAYHIPPKGDADTYALLVMDKILSSGRSSRLYSDLVYTRKLAQDVGTYTAENKDPGLFLTYATPLPGHSAGELEGELVKALDRLKTEDVADKELQKAVNQTEAAFYFGQQKDYELGVVIGTAESVRSWKLLDQYVSKIRSITKADIKRVAAKTFTKQNRSVITLVPTKEVKE